MIIYSKTETLKAKTSVKLPSKPKVSDTEDTIRDEDTPTNDNGKHLFEDYIRKYSEKAGRYFWQVS